MNKKIPCFAAIVIVFFTCGIIYLKPLSLSDIAEDNNQIKMVYCEPGVKNGDP